MANLFSFEVCHICAIEHGGGFLRVLDQLSRSEMGIPSDHRFTLPSTKFLQHIQRCSLLRKPACPRVPEIMPSEILDPCPYECILPAFCVRPYDGLATVRENSLGVLADLLRQYVHCYRVQRNMNRFACLRLIWVYPADMANQIYLRPFQTQHVALA